MSDGRAVLAVDPGGRPDIGGGASGSRRRRWPAWPAVLLLYLAGSVLLHRAVIGDLTGRSTGWISADSALFTWWLHWTPWAVLHGHDPLHTTWLNAPDGVNAMWNTAVPALGVLLAPITLTAGPTAAFNAGMVLGPAVSGLAAYGALRAHAGRWSCVLAGGLYGFSPFVVVHGWASHLNLVWLVLPPALAWAAQEVVRGRRPWRAGVVAGLALAVQTVLYTQLVVLGIVAVAVLATVLVVGWSWRVRDHVGGAGRAVCAAAGVWFVLCAYPLWVALAGPGRPRAVIRDAAVSSTDAAGLVVPTGSTALRAGGDGLAEELGGLASEQGSYLGIPLLVLVVLAAVTLASAVLRVAAATGALLALLSLGPGLRVFGHDTGVPLPWRMLSATPILDQAAAARLAPFVAMCVAVVVAIAVERVFAERRWLLLGAVVLAVASWLPSGNQPYTEVASPVFFSAGAPGLTRDDVVVTRPRPSGGFVGGADPMLWQSASGMAFRLSGGYFIGADPEHPVLTEGVATRYDRGPLAGAAQADLARAELEGAGVTAVVVVPRGTRSGPKDPEAVLAWTRRVTGDPGRRVDDVWLFRLVPR